MAVSILDATTNSGNNTSFTSNRQTFAKTISAGSARLLEVTIAWVNGVNANITGVTYGGQTMTSAGAAATNAVIGVQKFTLAEAGIAAASNTNIVVQWNDTPDWAVVGAIVFAGVASVGSYTSSSGTATSTSVAPASAGTDDYSTGALVISTLPTSTAGTSQYIVAGNGSYRAAASVRSGATNTMTWTNGGGEFWAVCGLRIVAAASGTTGTGSASFGGPALAASGAETFTGAGAEAFLGPALAASGTALLAITGSGGVAFTGPALAASGTETFQGAGTEAIVGPGLAATGTETFAGSGTEAIVGPALAGSGTETFTGAGAVAFVGPALAGAQAPEDGSITGAGAVAVQGPALAATGTETITGAGATAIAFQGPAAAGVETFQGDGTETIGGPALAGAGLLVIATGAGGVAFTGPALAASGVETFQGAGSEAFVGPALAASGQQTITGVGGVAFAGPALQGYDAIPAISGAGEVSFGFDVAGRGTGAPDQAGSGRPRQGIKRLFREEPWRLPIVGVGAVAFAGPDLAGRGTVEEIAPVTVRSFEFRIPAPSFTGTGAITYAGTASVVAPSVAIAGRATVDNHVRARAEEHIWMGLNAPPLRRAARGPRT